MILLWGIACSYPVPSLPPSPYPFLTTHLGQLWYSLRFNPGLNPSRLNPRPPALHRFWHFLHRYLPRPYLPRFSRSFQGFTCLMQMSTRSTDYVVDTLTLRKQLGPALASVFADSSVIKVRNVRERCRNVT